jgi:hypothetical protein
MLNYCLFIRTERKDTRCCDEHLENNDKIKCEEYLNIKKTDQLFEKAPLELLDICLSKIEKKTSIE